MVCKASILKSNKKEKVKKGLEAELCNNSLNLFNSISKSIHARKMRKTEILPVHMLEPFTNDNSNETYYKRLLPLLLKKHKTSITKIPCYENGYYFYIECLTISVNNARIKITPSLVIVEEDETSHVYINLIQTITKIKLLIKKEARILDETIILVIQHQLKKLIHPQ